MQSIEPLLHGNFYHIYNCGINGTELFKEADNYRHFLNCYEKYIETVAETYAWCLMGNHFHFLVRIKEKKEIGFYLPLNADRSGDAVRLKASPDLSASEGPDSVNRYYNAKPDPNTLKAPDPSRHYSHLFNAYTRYFNLKYSRHGALFERPFKRKKIESDNYLKNLIIYIHNNPVHHSFCSHPVEYPWSSYLTCISEKPTRLKRQQVIDYFDDRANFSFSHRLMPNLTDDYSLE